MLEVAKTKEDLPPDTDLECPICYDQIDLDKKKDGELNCIICENGHRWHGNCLDSTHKHECPVCRNKNMKYCKSRTGYLYAPRKGGKSRSKKFTKKNKSNKTRRSLKRRKTNKRRKSYK